MGFLKDLATLTAQGNAAYARMDVGASLDAAGRSMEEAGRVLAATTPRPDEEWLEAVRLRTTATVVDARQLPVVIGMNVVVELDLVVAMPSGFPLPVSRTASSHSSSGRGVLAASTRPASSIERPAASRLAPTSMRA